MNATSSAATSTNATTSSNASADLSSSLTGLATGPTALTNPPGNVLWPETYLPLPPNSHSSSRIQEPDFPLGVALVMSATSVSAMGFLTVLSFLLLRQRPRRGPRPVAVALPVIEVVGQPATVEEDGHDESVPLTSEGQLNASVEGAVVGRRVNSPGDDG